jgi:DUF1365 family protein
VVIDSAIYWGRVTHDRFLPREHKFTYQVMMFDLYLDELDEIARDVKGIVLEGNVTERSVPRRWLNLLPARYVLRRQDFLPQYSGSLDEAARVMYFEHVGEVAPGRIAILTNLRSLGWNFNPISLYFFYDGTTIINAVAEVTNTPWLERHLYVLGPPGAVEFEKAHHVSPFLEMAGRYRLTYFKPNERFRLSMKLFDLDAAASDGLGAKRFTATMNFDRVGLTSREVARAARRYPDMAFRVSFRIYVQAARLFAKRIRYVPHPKLVKGEMNVPRT